MQRVILHGGGTTAPETTKRLIALAGGPAARIVVLAHTGEDVAGKAKRSADWLREMGATSVLAPIAIPEALDALPGAGGVWIPGGDQSALTAAFAGTDLAARLRKIPVVGGTSAGAALMGSLMPTGKGDAKKMQRGSVEAKPGLGMLSHTVVDTHFFVRERAQRLLNILYSQPAGTLGIGLDEDAWAEVEGKRLQVRAGQVLLIERRREALTVRILDAGASVALP